MDLDEFRVIDVEPGRVRIEIPHHARFYLRMFSMRLRASRTVRRVHIAASRDAVELDYDCDRHTLEEFLAGLAYEFGFSLDPSALVIESTGHGVPQEPSAQEPPAQQPPAQEPLAPAVATSNNLPVPYAVAAESEAAPAPELAAEDLGWTVRSAIPGRVRLYHPLLARRADFRTAVERCLTNLAGMTTFDVSAIAGTVLIRFDPAVLNQDALLRALAVAAQAVLHDAPEDAGQAMLDTTALRLVTSSASMALSLCCFLVPALRPLATAVTALAGTHIVLSGAHAIVVERRMRVDVLDATVITLALAYQKLLAAGFMIWVVDLSNVLLAASSRAQQKTLAELFGRQVPRAWRVENGVEFDRPVTDLGIGDVIVVHAGEQVPVDGEIVCGEATVDRSALTGEHAPVEAVAGDRVLAMSVVLTGSLRIEVQQTGADTTAARMVQIVADSLEHQPKLQSLTERFADGMVVPSLGLGGLAYGIGGSGPMLAVINADFGTGIRIAGPLAMLSSLSAAAHNGILIKKGQVLEDLNNMSAVVFDKTGTLTEEVPELGRVFVFHDTAADDLLACAAAAEARFAHPIARGIIAAAEARALAVPVVEDAGYTVGLGVHVRVDGRPIAIGSHRYMRQLDIAVSPYATECAEDIHRGGGTAIFVAIDGRLEGVLELVAQARQEAAALVRYLREQRGIEEIHLLSGDHSVPVANLAQQLGIPHFRAAMLPEEKSAYVADLQTRGFKVAMFGDGVNDTAGLAQANYSISLRGAADAATDVADIVFLDGSLAKFQLLTDISSNLSRNVKRSFVLTLTPNAICMAGAMAGLFGLEASLLFNNVGNLVTVANGMRAQSGLDAGVHAGVVPSAAPAGAAAGQGLAA